MKRVLTISTITLVVLALGCTTTPETGRTARSGPNAFTPNELLLWDFYGIGDLAPMDTETIRMSEGENSKGVMIISPESYPGDVTLSYQVNALNPASVLVALLCLSDPGNPDAMTVPVSYDGNIEWLLRDEEDYFFAFHNAAHNSTPFLRRHPGGGEEGTKLAELAQNFMRPEVWYSVEAGREKGRVWLKVDGVTVLEAFDPAPLSGGRVALRIRGTPETMAECLIRNVSLRVGQG